MWSASLEEAFYQRTKPIDGGHMVWTGARDGATPMVYLGQVKHSARVVAFWLRTGFEPIGYVRPECDLPGCVAPAHVEDKPNSDRLRRHLAFLHFSASIPTQHSPERRAS
jgi:hypothetical protein